MDRKFDTKYSIRSFPLLLVPQQTTGLNKIYLLYSLADIL